jgi:hypothetical protein
VEDLDRFIALFRKYLGQEQNPAHVALLPGIRAERLETPEALAEARAFLVLQLMRRGKLLELPETNFARSNICYALRAEGRLTAVLELTETKGGFRVLNFGSAPELESTDLGALFLKRVLQRLLGRQSQLTLSVSVGSQLEAWLPRLGKVERDSGEGVFILSFQPVSARSEV